jgi:hypothetical protein
MPIDNAERDRRERAPRNQVKGGALPFWGRSEPSPQKRIFKSFELAIMLKIIANRVPRVHLRRFPCAEKGAVREQTMFWQIDRVCRNRTNALTKNRTNVLTKVPA